MLPEIVPSRTGLFSDFQRSMNRLMKDFFEDLPVNLDRATPGEFVPRLDFKDKKDKLIVKAELPGMEEKDVDILIEDDFLTIKGEKRAEKEEQDGERRVTECSYGAFERTVRLPQGVEGDKAQAKFSKGVLTIELPKAIDARKEPKKIPIKH
jgi:HSP20 family protein